MQRSAGEERLLVLFLILVPTWSSLTSITVMQRKEYIEDITYTKVSFAWDISKNSNSISNQKGKFIVGTAEL